MRADLHIHTKYSFDGDTSIDDIFSMAKKQQVDCIALTDHNDVRANSDALKYDRSLWIPGIEIDCYYENSIYHIIGLGIDFKDTIYRTITNNYLNELERIMNIRIHVFNRLFGLNMHIHQVQKANPGILITNVEITRFMFENFPQHPQFQKYLRLQRDTNPVADFYWDFCAIKKPGYVKMVLPNVQDVINYIHQTRGIAILAHPLISVKSLTDVKKLTSLDGIEAYCSYHSEQQCLQVKQFAKDENLLISAGSDYHGKNKPAIVLGDTHDNDESDEWFFRIKDAIAHRK
jgi:predicted metal-dependent phosphoesterase TrpH